MSQPYWLIEQLEDQRFEFIAVVGEYHPPDKLILTGLICEDDHLPVYTPAGLPPALRPPGDLGHWYKDRWPVHCPKIDKTLGSFTRLDMEVRMQLRATIKKPTKRIRPDLVIEGYYLYRPHLEPIGTVKII